MYKILIITIFIVISCNNKPEVKNDSNSKILKAYLDEKTLSPVKLSDFIDSVMFIPITSDSNNFIGNITDIRFCRDHFYVLDSKTTSILKINWQGDIVGSINKRGRGHGEYLNINAFDVNPINGDVHIYDWALKHILVYDNNEIFLREVSVKDVIRDLAVFSNGEYVFYTPDYMKENRRGAWRADVNGNFKEQLIIIDENFKYGGIHPKYFQRINDDIVGLMGGEDYNYIYHIKSDSLIIKYKLNIDRELSSEIKSLNDFDPKKYKGHYYTKNNYNETEKMLMLQVVDADKRLLLFYNKNNQQLSYARQEDELVEDVKMYTMPRFSSNGLLIGSLEPFMILQFAEIKKRFPSIAENSNPVLVVGYSR